jgi:hypothetical protein
MEKRKIRMETILEIALRIVKDNTEALGAHDPVK